MSKERYDAGHIILEYSVGCVVYLALRSAGVTTQPYPSINVLDELQVHSGWAVRPPHVHCPLPTGEDPRVWGSDVASKPILAAYQKLNK